ncbi:hypothetical protein [Verrucosispora sp. WMMC514]|uniref:hypothetical protein n=1 Tax=Verrucosispora sp. WMMC514 TaxID=3015156 RepID=UPI00248BE20B|nr:hypothetical protein [Verrucosispora sp. WMMC514]WBB94223.1 hypothetical protein O7597_15340 [Verrucosispora sp. WMMC514]
MTGQPDTAERVPPEVEVEQWRAAFGGGALANARRVLAERDRLRAERDHLDEIRRQLQAENDGLRADNGSLRRGTTAYVAENARLRQARDGLAEWATDAVVKASEAGYALAVGRLRDDDRYRDWWSASGVKPDGPMRRHLADYLESVGPDGVNVRAAEGPEPAAAGRCGDRLTSPPAVLAPLAPIVCALPHGHTGWHRSDQGTEWTNTSDGEATRADDEPAGVDLGDPAGYEIVARRLHRDRLGQFVSGVVLVSAVSETATLREAFDELVRALGPAADVEPPVSSVIAVDPMLARSADGTPRYARAAGHPAGGDWVRLCTGSGREYEGYRDPSCPGDGVAGHLHDVRCVKRVG